MAKTKRFVITEKIYVALTTRGMDLRCQCTLNGRDGCLVLLQPFDEVVSKPTKRGRKYYLAAHYDKMYIDV